MPSYNLMPILFPRPKQDDTYGMLKTLMNIREKDIAIGEGGTTQNPKSYNELIQKCYQNANNSSTEKERNSWILKAKGYEQKQIVAAVDEVKEVDVSSWKQRVEETLSWIEHTNTSQIGSFVENAAREFDFIVNGTSEDSDDGMNQQIAVLKANGANTAALENYRDYVERQRTKYLTIANAFEQNDMETLNEFTIVYTPFSGKVGDINGTSAMRIVSRSESMPDNSHFTNMKYVVKDLENTATGEKERRIAMGSDSENGMSVAFLKSGTSDNDTIHFSNSSFNYYKGKWEIEDVNNFDYRTIKHAAFHDMRTGDFARANNGKLYYVNKDKSLSRVQDKYKEELNFSEDRVHNLNPEDEINILPGVLDSSLNPIQQRLKGEFEAGKEGVPGAMDIGDVWKGLEPASDVVAKGMDESLSKFVSSLPQRTEAFGKSFVGDLKEAFGRVGKAEGRDKVFPKWEEPTTEPVNILEQSKKWIQGIK